MYLKEEISKYSQLKYDNFEKYGLDYLVGEIDEETEEIPFFEFEESITVELNYDNGYFFQLQVNRFGDKLLLEYTKLGDEDGYYKDWSYKKFMESLKEVCVTNEYVFINNYDLSEDDNFFRAFFITMMVDIHNYKNFNEVYLKCDKICRTLIDITEKRLQGIWWNDVYEKDEILFCSSFLTPYFNSLKFDKVIFNHGSKEFGKDYILEITNVFGDKEYYGVQVKAGTISGSSQTNINELDNQIDMAFDVPYKFKDGREVFVSKVLVVI